MKNFFLVLLCLPALTFAAPTADVRTDTAWSPAQAKHEAEKAVGVILDGQKLLKYAIQAKDKAGWENWLIQILDKSRDAMTTQSWSLQNKNFKRYEDCESALLAYSDYSKTFFLPESMMNLRDRDLSNEDFKHDFSACKKAVGWRG